MNTDRPSSRGKKNYSDNVTTIYVQKQINVRIQQPQKRSHGAEVADASQGRDGTGSSGSRVNILGRVGSLVSVQYT